ncbi:MAG: glycine--tRNA ligase subunit beta [Anaerolineales bacterium]|nr:glycine--tRNA ligase subunit beta [Anaerolineales bacterium]MCW5855639.1 glycine--tRNA ligase subunit beta [Anaerolineales bacterium]
MTTSAPTSPDFQTLITRLQQFWADAGCVVWQPYNEKVGAGTMNPATFLRVLGPEPWNVAYVEPSVRPDDGRYGENPNRMQQHTQFQVILKPDPGNPQDIYLRSLEAIGVDVHKHDIRFVEDNWASPALGAWGLGWEVWLDGLEITQFTYFQQSGGIALDPVSVEITYGLDRIAMAMQGVKFVGDLRWDGRRSWGDMYMQGEREHSKYYFEVASVERNRKLAELYEAEAKAALEAGVLLPAYDYLLKTSHTFNVLDARGAIGVTERQAYFRRMRGLANQVAEAYLAQRQHEEFPWLETESAAARTGSKPAPATAMPTSAADFLLEIGTEELPAGEVPAAIAQLEAALAALLTNQHLEYQSLGVGGTPRRLAAQVRGLAPGQPDRHQVVKGPPAARAFGADGRPTPAAEGFARGQGVNAADLAVETIDGGEYVVAKVHQKGRPAAEVLAAELPKLIAGLKFEQSMRWNASAVHFSRPIRWLLALHGEHLVAFEYAGLHSAAASRGLRLGAAAEFAVKSPADYQTQLKKQAILLDPAERRAAIEAQIAKLAKAAGGSVPADPGLLDEVTHLVEAPAALVGEFEAEYLQLPREVLIAVMRKHQRCFPLEKDGALLNKFIAVGNGDFDVPTVTAGNAAVIRARFADAAYFVRRDREQPLASYLEPLRGLTFQKDLGSMYDKAGRIRKLVAELGPGLGLSAAEQATAERAAELSKADLVSKMVVEMTSLQGVMGKYYALDSGEPAEVAEAIFEHYLPRYAGDATPKGAAGFVVSLADRLDSLAGLFALGLEPTGAKDPFAQRRAAIGLVQSLIARDADFDLRAGLAAAAAAQPVPVSAEAQGRAAEFVVQRLRALLLEGGARHDVVDAVLAAQGHNPAAAARGVQQLAAHSAHKAWAQVLPAFARCVRITRELPQRYALDAALLQDEAEKVLYAALQTAGAVERRAGSVDDFLKAFMPMIPAINRFFEEVLVMAEDPGVKNNRLGLLQAIAALADGVGDFSKLEGF